MTAFVEDEYTVWPDLRTLKLLVDIGQLGSVTAAAKQAQMNQSNASRALSRLERQLGIHLFDRSRTGSTLTEQGLLVAEWSKVLLDEAACWQAGIHSLAEAAESHLEIAASQTVAEYLAPIWLAAFRNQHPNVVTKMSVANSVETTELVRSGEATLGFIETPALPSDLTCRPVYTDKLTVIVNPGHPWARRKRPLTLAELAATPLVTREEGSGTRKALEDAATGLKMADPALVASSNAAVIGSVAAGFAPAVLSELAIAAPLSTGQVARIQLADCTITRVIHAIWQPPLVGPAVDLVKVVKQRGPKHD